MFRIRDLRFSYQIDGRSFEVLKGLDFTIRKGDFVAIQGPSGSGKSTLFYILGFLLRPTSGDVFFENRELTKYSDDDLAWIRNRRVGFVFQQFHLLSGASVLENIMLPVSYPLEVDRPADRQLEKATQLAESLGLQDHLTRKPNQLSGGQQQRVAIARALMNDVDLILADEPTGNLDSKNAKQILDLLAELNAQGKTVIIITHDSEVAKRCSKVLHLRDGAFEKSAESVAPSPDSPRAAPTRPPMPHHLTPAHYMRLFRAVAPVALDNLLRNRSKSLLTMLGVVIGVAAVLAMVTLGQFTKRKILASYETLGVNKIVVRGQENWQLAASDYVPIRFKGFEVERDVKPLKKLFPQIHLIAPVAMDGGNKAMAGGLSIEGGNSIDAIGTSPEYLLINNRKVQSGHPLSEYQVEARNPVCLVGLGIVERLFAHSSPLGQLLTLSDGQRTSYPCRIVGVLAASTTNKEWSKPNLNVILPYTYFQSAMTGSGRDWNARIQALSIQLRSGSDVEKTAERIKGFFVQRYGKAGEFWVDSDSALIEQMRRFLNIFAVLLTAIALISLAVGGIGINNMMLVSVTDRFREFGIRKALGATNRSIRMQVLSESVLLCATAGILGVILGFAAYQLMIFGATRFVGGLQFEWVFEPLAIAASLLSIVAVGIASGFVPAVKAEKLQIIEALRSE